MRPYDRAQRVGEWESVEFPVPFRGMNSLLPRSRIPQEAAFALQNADLSSLILQKRWGTKNFGGSISGFGRIQRFGSFLTVDGAREVYVISTNGLASYEGASGWVVRISGLSGTPVVIPAHVDFMNEVVFCNGANRLQAWDGIAPTGREITGSPVARAIGALGGRVLVGNLFVGGSRYASRIKWSDYLNVNVWSGGSSGEADLIDTNDEIMAFASLRDQLVVVRRRSIWGISIAEPPFFYRFEKMYEGLGTVAAGSVCSVPGGVIFLGPDDLYVFDGSSAIPLLPREFGLRRFMQERVTLEGLQRAIGAVWPSRSQYWLSIPLDASTDNSAILVFDYENRYLMGIYTFQWSGLGVAEASEGTDFWVDYPDFWNAYDIPWAQMVALTQERMLGCAVGTTQPLLVSPVLNDAGNPIELVWESPLVSMAGGEHRGTDLKVAHRVQVFGEAGTGPFTVELGFSHDGSTVTYTQPFVVDTGQPDWVFDPSVATEAQWWCVRVKSGGVNNSLRINSVVLWFTVLSPQRVDANAWRQVVTRRSSG